MLTNNNNTPSSAPPPPPPPPPPGWKNTDKHNDKDGKSPSVTAEKSSSGTQLKRGLSEVSNPNFLEELKNNSKFKEANNASDKTADKGSKNSIHVKNPETRNSAQSKEEDNASDKTKNDRSNTKQVVPKKPMTGQHNGVQSDSENQKSSVAEQKKATGLKYSIAILLLCTSGSVAVVYTYFIISAVLSSAAVPVSSAVIAFVSALVMLSSAVYLINSHISAINSEKGVDPGRKQSQYSELQKETESLEHSNTTISSPKMSGTPSTPPPPPLPPVKSNDLSTAPRVTRKSSPSDANQKNVQQKQSNTSVDARSDLLAAIRQPRTLKKVPDEQKNYLPKDDLKIPQKQEEESAAEKRENGVQTLNQNQSQNSDSQAAKKLEHNNSDTTTGPIRKVENQKTDKEPSNSEGIQQMDSLAIAIQKQRGRSGFQNAQLDSLDEQEDSLFYLEEKSFTEQNKTVNQGQKNCVQKPDIGLILYNALSTTLSTESPINNLSSNSGNAPDYGDWDTQPQSIPYIYCDKTRQEMRQEKKEKGASPSATKGSGADQVSNEVQDPSTLPLNERREIFAAKV
ncbi:hypothetical protein WSTR_05740 [Wolbachia endosymbiont of Laodelphax striatellus]|uniref:hypothetical protein n=1 Tax=Wolbachia endosymbiont of Laodelphax striatellus TaxID=368602 RepID=UPI0007C4733B|nr:hypothetical protein [Wolbachia endosymbiont of Laodelphax striatellus]OAB78386.1 hypothetical protein WSTR_05740 [Wolbachia endosymbiont of Laodelphax striatellus]